MHSTIPSQTVRFREEQRCRQLWIWLLTLALCGGSIGYLFWAMVEQLVMGRPVGSKPMSDPMLMVVGPLLMLLMAGALWLLWSARLVTEVRGDGIHIRYEPFHRRFHRFLWEEIESVESCTYRPVRDLGGWGIRVVSGGKSYTVSGNRGVRFSLKGQRSGTILIGSQSPEELAAAIHSSKDSA